MDLSTYDGLLESVTITAMRQGDTEFTTAVPSFIRMCEARMSRELRTRHNETRATISFVDGIGALPQDYAQYRSLVFSPCGDKPGFEIIGNNIETSPAWSGDAAMVYFTRVPALGPSRQTNWALENFPDLYLYGALIEAAPFVLDDQRVGTWGQFFDNAMRAIAGDEMMAKYANVSSHVRGATP